MTTDKPLGSFYDSGGYPINKEDIVWFDPLFVDVENFPDLKKPFMVAGLSKKNHDILVSPIDNLYDLHRTNMTSVTHENPYQDV